jgi:hypothetical protein
MYFRGKNKENGRLKTLALTLVIWGFANVDAFYSTISSLSSSSLRMPKSSLGASLSTPTTHPGMGSGDDQPSKKITIKRNRKQRPSRTFQQYLKGLSSNGFKSKWKLAQRMDDELKRMEMIVYDLTKEDDPSYASLRTEQLAFAGEQAKPDERCYATVCSAYANAGYGETAALMAEKVMARYERLSGEQANTHITTAVMKAWVRVDNWEKADLWLQAMEDRYSETGDARYAPDCVTYTSYISGLSTTTSLDKDTAGTRSLDMLHKMRNLYFSGENPAAMPNRYTYSAVMKSQERSCSGCESIERAEKVFRLLEEDYRNIGTIALKPNAIVGSGILHAAAHCGGGIKAAKKAEEIFEEFQQRFRETGDEDYRPLEGMYTSLFASYGKVEAKSAEKCARKVDALLEEMKTYGIEAKKYTLTAGKMPLAFVCLFVCLFV